MIPFHFVLIVIVFCNTAGSAQSSSSSITTIPQPFSEANECESAAKIARAQVAGDYWTISAFCVPQR